MGLIEQEISELRQMTKDVLSGKVSPEMAALQIGIANQIAKRTSQMIQIVSMAVKEGKKGIGLSRLVEANIVGDGSAVLIEGGEADLIKCPEMGGRVIAREICLDFSGETKNIENCQKCKQFSITRKYFFNATKGR